MKQKFILLISATFALTGLAIAADEPASLSWEKWQTLIGNWKAKGNGAPGEGTGGFSFSFELQNKVILRKSHTEYPAAGGRPAFAHDDLIIIYADEASHRFRADYYDNEGHVIRYTAQFSPDGKTLTLLSDPAPSQPVFRLTYNLAAPDVLGIKFEIAAPNTPGDFKVYVQGTAQRASGA